MRRNVLIVDKSVEYAKRIEKMAVEISNKLNIFMAHTVEDAYRCLMETTMDIFIVNVTLDSRNICDTSGLRLVERVREIPKYTLTPVILTSYQEDMRVHAYKELNCLAFLDNPLIPKEFAKAMNKAVMFKTNRTEDRVLFFRKDGIIYAVRVEEIAYIQSVDHVMHFHLTDGTVEVFPYRSFQKLLEEADVDYLMQCRRDIVVNKNFILGLDFINGVIILRKKMGIVMIGARFRKRVKEDYMKKCPMTRDEDGIYYSCI